MKRKDCFAYISNKQCNALIEIDCNYCRFYKSKEQWRKEVKNEKIRNNKKQNR
jgi:hypothetical protein